MPTRPIGSDLTDWIAAVKTVVELRAHGLTQRQATGEGKHMRPHHLRRSEVRIDPFEPSDLPTVAAFAEAIQEHERASDDDLKPGVEINPSYLAMLGRNVADRRGAMLMARTTVGFVCAWKERDNDALLREEAQDAAYVSDIFVVEPWRGVGVGRLLLEAIEAEMALRGCRRLRICSKARNAVALCSYEPRRVPSVWDHSAQADWIACA